MTRNKFLLNSAVALSALSSLDLLAQNLEHNHEQEKISSTSKNSSIKMAVVHCLMDAEDCLSHCIELMGNGDKSLANCAKSTRDVLATCNAFLSMLSQNSSFTPRMAVLCVEVCQTCAKECKKHAKHHEACKKCMDSCNACIKEMKKLV